MKPDLQHLGCIPEGSGHGIHAADVAIEQVHQGCALPPQLGVKVDATCHSRHPDAGAADPLP